MSDYWTGFFEGECSISVDVVAGVFFSSRDFRWTSAQYMRSMEVYSKGTLIDDEWNEEQEIADRTAVQPSVAEFSPGLGPGLGRLRAVTTASHDGLTHGSHRTSQSYHRVLESRRKIEIQALISGYPAPARLVMSMQAGSVSVSGKESILHYKRP